MTDLRCHRCSKWMGESSRPVELIGLFKYPEDRHVLAPPRESVKCPSCGWTNVFLPVGSAPWRHFETKHMDKSAAGR